MRKLFVVAMMVCLASTAWSASFVNGGFENGDFTGWTAGSGYWSGVWPIDPANYQVGGTDYNAGANASAIVTPGNDPIVGAALNQVYAGNYSARINNSNNNYSVSTIKQTVLNYTDTHIFFEWAAVLQSSHGATDSDNFTLTLTDDTAGTTLYSVAYNSATNGPIFTYTNGWYYTPWQTQDLDVSTLSGHDFSLTLLASDCPYGGHAGYVYLDGFGAVSGGGGDDEGGNTQVPEPGTMMLLGSGLVGLAAWRRMK